MIGGRAYALLARLIRYNVVQVVAYAVDLGLFLALFHIAVVPALFANAAGKVASGLLAFALHRRFTFRSDGHAGGEALRYFLLACANIPLSSGLLLLAELVLPTTAAKVAADVAGMPLTFTLVQLLVFRPAARRAGRGASG